MARAIMLQGTGSDVGKSLIAAGLARAFVNRGLKVSPFKPQNMSNNAAVTVDGGEIGRAQALQARAAKVAPVVHMNPILLKPETTTGAQVIVQGKRHASMGAREYFSARERFMPAILDSFRRLVSASDLVIVEGAGSPAEVNLRTGDLANMGFAHAAGVPVVLVGDIHRGGVIASLVGTFAVLPPEDAAMIRGTLINNFHGDPSLFDEGIRIIEARTGVPCLGVVPHFADARKLPAEDAVALERAGTSGNGPIKICVLRLSRIANFDDLDPLKLEPGVSLSFVQPGEPIPGDASLVIIPGSKATIADLADLRAQGWDVDLHAHVRRGGAVLGVCGGYQILGTMIHDPEGLEGPPGSAPGLGLLDVETVLTPDKTLKRVSGTHSDTGLTIDGYEIHLGTTTGPATANIFAMIDGHPDGAVSPSGRVAGTYLHGCFGSDAFRRAYLQTLGAAPGNVSFEAEIEAVLDRLAAHLEASIDVNRLLSLAAEVAE
ncbi:MAG: cobyric acid synthase [Hyphomicrobiales bacterium]